MKTAYDDDYHVIHGILGRMFAAKKEEKESYESLRAIWNAITSGTRQLQVIANQGTLWDQVWIHFAKQRLPKYTFDSWEQFRNRHGNKTMPTLQEFQQFLDVKSKGRREFETDSAGPSYIRQGNNHSQHQSQVHEHSSRNNRFKPYDRKDKYHDQSKPVVKSTNPFAPYRGQSQDNKGPSQCRMSDCNQVHYLGQCPRFKDLSYQQRMDIIMSQRLCRCCLMSGHTAFNCSWKGCSSCPDEKVKHHFRLCPKTTSHQRASENVVNRGAHQGPPKQ